MIEDYYTNPAISQSQLKLLLGPDPSIFNTIQEPDLYFEEKKHFIIGDGVDIQLTRPTVEFNQKFHISNVQNKPSDTIKSIKDDNKFEHETKLTNHIISNLVIKNDFDRTYTINYYRKSIELKIKTLQKCQN